MPHHNIMTTQADKQNPYTALQWGEHYLHMSDGMYFADEEVTYEGSGPQPTGNHSGGHSAGRGTETCSVVETMFSMRTAYEITGNITFMDRLERLAFNALPAALWPDVTANVYHHRSNQLSCGGQYGFNLFFCCSSNVHQGWPKFMLGAVQLKGYSNSTSHVNGAGVSDDDGNSGADGNDDDVVVVSGYAPSVTTLPNSAGVVNVSGSYPFSDTVVITVSKPTTLQLRIPCWTTGATVAVDDAAGTLGLDDAPAAGQPRHQHRHHQRQPQPQPCSFYTVSATSSVKITFDVPIVFYRWAANQTDGSYSGKTYNSPAATNGGEVEVHRGALTFALRPAEVVEEEPIGCIGGSPDGRYGWNCTGTPGGVPQFPAIKSRNVNVATAPGSGGNWSYGILPDTATFVTLGDGTPPRGIPFAVDAPPAVVIKVKARNLNYGGARVWADPAVPPHSPLSSSAPLEEITLVPFGATNIRISAFPQLIS